MNFRVTYNVGGVFEQLETRLETLKPAAQVAMAEEFYSITLQNFGATGVDRPAPWAPLSPAYAKRKAKMVGRTTADLELSFALVDSIRVDHNEDFSEVWTGNPYAGRHQFGEAGMPLRPFMPLVGDQLTPFTEKAVVEAAEKVLTGGGGVG